MECRDYLASLREVAKWLKGIEFSKKRGSKLYECQALASKVASFEKLLPPVQSELALQTMKDPYFFDFCLSARRRLSKM